MAQRKNAPMPLAIFPAAVSAPHLYAIAVMKLYVEFAVGASKLTLTFPTTLPTLSACQAVLDKYQAWR